MDWGYKRERHASLDEIAEVIHASVTIRDALDVYCPGLEIRHHRCPCPIHSGEDYNFSFTDRGFKCFVCNASGDVIHLPVDFYAEISPEVSTKVNKLREEAEQKRREKSEWEEKYNKALDEWIELDKIVMDTPWDSEENIAKVCKAKEDRARVGYQLDLILAQEPR